MWSIHYRGSKEDPGLVLALETDSRSSCRGVAYKCRDDKAEEVMTTLRRRELISSAYREERARVTLADGRRVLAIFYAVDTSHPQYCGNLPTSEKVKILSRAQGQNGFNRDYLFETCKALTELGLSDDYLTTLAARVRAVGQR